MHSMTRRRASPGPSGRLQVAMAFSQISSRGCRGRTERRHWMNHSQDSDDFTLNLLDGLFIWQFIIYWMWVLDVPVQQVVLCSSPTHPLRGCHTGSLLHTSLRILRTMTQDLRSVTLAWGDRQTDRQTDLSDSMRSISTRQWVWLSNCRIHVHSTFQAVRYGGSTRGGRFTTGLCLIW